MKTTNALLDANILLHYLTEDIPEKTDRCERLIKKATKGQLRLRVPDFCVADVVWVLVKYYRTRREDIAEKLMALLNTPGLEFANPTILRGATRRFGARGVDFTDAYLAAEAAFTGTAVYSYDRDLDKFSDVTRQEP
ncbi:MAG: PIN domain-containing protein [Myxococcota bacterium]